MKHYLAALAALTLATPALADAPANPFARESVRLNLAGIDPATADGQRRLAIRMDRAVRAVCGERLANIHLAAESKARACRDAVTADVRAQIEARPRAVAAGMVGASK